MAEQSLKDKAFKGVFWTAYNRGGSMVLALLSNIILARLLTPADFGAIGMVMVFVYLSNILIDSGFGSALIQKKEPSPKDYNTIFFWNLGLSLILYVVLFFCSPLVAKFYGIEILSKILKIVGLILIINALSLIQTVLLKRELNFKKLAHCYITSTFCALLSSSIAAYYGCGVWSLVIFQLVQAGGNSLLLWIFTKWHPEIMFSWQSFKSLFNFGGFVLLSSLTFSVYRQAQSLIIGKLFNESTLGYFTQANTLQNSPSVVINTVVSQVSYPVFTQLQDNKTELFQKYKRIISSVGLFIFPFVALLMILIKPIIVLFLSDKWLPSVPIFQILCISGMINPIIDISCQLIAAIGKSKVLFYRNLTLTIAGLASISIGALFGLYGVLIGMVIYTYLGYFIFYPIIKKCFGIGYFKQLGCISSSFIISYVAMIPIIIISYYNLETSNIYISGVINFFLYLTIFIILVMIFKRQEIFWVFHSLKSIIKNFHK